MPLLKDGSFAQDAWIHLDDDTAIPAKGDIIVSFARLLKDYGQLKARTGRLGVAFPNSETPGTLDTFVGALSLIVLDFPSFADGRAYSQARHLRQQGFDGELRATGNILPDQLAFMLETGFETFEVSDRFDEATWQQAARGLSLSYQPVHQRGRNHVWKLRWARD